MTPCTLSSVEAMTGAGLLASHEHSLTLEGPTCMVQPDRKRRRVSSQAPHKRASTPKGNQTMSCDRNPWRNRELGIGVLLLVAAAAFPVLAHSQSPAIGAWEPMRPQLYGTRDIGEVDDQLMRIQAPGTTPDPAA